jgi:hypothetical protein
MVYFAGQGHHRTTGSLINNLFSGRWEVLPTEDSMVMGSFLIEADNITYMGHFKKSEEQVTTQTTAVTSDIQTIYLWIGHMST